ncbi:MAG TPA: hypothetical protein VFL63_05240 [Rhodanobacteraceae bacterium]|nr:hypothetical protein [Rhodanobacteraceae bacterium]
MSFKNLQLLPLLLALPILATGIAQAAPDPLPGTWTAPPSREDTAMGLTGTTLTVAAAPGGYTFSSVAHGKHGDMQATLPTIPDGKPHTGSTTFGPATATCHRTDPRTLACEVRMGPSPPSQSTFVLSADGKTLTETDTSASNDSTSAQAAQHTVTTTTVFHRQ